MKELSTYLNDHLAGSVGALEMLDDLIESREDKPLESFLKTLRADIQSDQDDLKQLMARLKISESRTRKAGAWVTEKFSRVKLGVGDAGKSDLALLQSLESLSLGITGKRSLWRTLGAIAEISPRMRDLDFAELEKRALDQIERVEAKVTEIGREIFSADLKS